MDFLQTGVFSLAEQRLAWADRRQELLSQNIANADTPGWRSRDLPSFSQTLGDAPSGPALTLTSAGHMTGTLDGGPAPLTAKPPETAPDGNSVVIEDELTKVADTQGAQAVAANLYGKYMGFFRTAFGRSSS